MNPLQVRLAALRRRLRLVVSVRGLAATLALLLILALAGGFLDWRFHLPSLVRAILLVFTVAASGYVGLQYLLRPLIARSDDLTLALRIESHFPILNDSLASAVEFLEKPLPADSTISPLLQQEAVQRALRRARDLDFRPVVATRGLHAASLSLAASGALALAVSLLFPQMARTAFLRLAHPFGAVDWPRQTILDVHSRSLVAQGEPFEIDVTVWGQIPERARVQFRFDNGAPLDQVYDLQVFDDFPGTQFSARLEASRVQRNFRYQVWANDAVSPVYEVQVLPPPQLVPLAGRPSPQSHVHFPAYTDLVDLDLPDGSSTIEAVAGAEISLRAATDRRIVRAWISFPPELEPSLSQVANLAGFAAPLLTQVMDKAVAARVAGLAVPVEISPDGRVLTAELTARVTGMLTLHFEDELGLSNARLLFLRTAVDPAPSVQLLRPSRSQDSLNVMADADITLQVQVEDSVFAVRSADLEYRWRRGEALGPLQILPLYEAGPLEHALPHLLSLSGSPWANLVGLELHLRPQRVEVLRRWNLTSLALEEGDVLLLQARATDFDDVTAAKAPGRSHVLELHIIGRTALDLALNEAQARIQEELLRLDIQQRDALQKVIPAEAHAKTSQGQLQPRHVDDLLQAEQLQQQIQARVGTPQDGLRSEVARALQTLRDNHLPRTSIQDRLDAVAAELERLQREDLKLIEPQLVEARKQSDLGKRSPSSAPEKPRPLTEARKHQEEVKKTLDGLLQLLEPWSTSREVKGEAKSLLQEQRQVRDDTDRLGKETLGKELFELSDNQRAELQKNAELQNKLSERAGQLLEKMDRLSQQLAARERNNPEAAPESKSLEQAAQQGRASDLSGKMQDAERNLRQNQLGKASQDQADSLQALDQMVKTLEDRREEELDRLIKKMKQAEQQLADLADRQELLQKKAKEASALPEGRERAEALKRLAREQERLQQETQDLLRELSRLRAERAGQALAQATGRMDQAGRQLTQGTDAEEQQEEALDRLNEAQKQLQEAREQVEEELAREKLAKVADVIKGLRDRHQALIAEEARIHRTVLQSKSWGRGLLLSLGSLADSQKDLADETDRLAKEKLEGAKVFAHLLVRSAEAMTQASQRIQERKDRALDRNPDAAERTEPALDIAAEQKADAETGRWQQQALRRLDLLLDSLKPEPGMRMRSGSQRAAPEGQAKSKGGAAAGDDLPPIAQMKALRALQQELNDRTQAFDKKHRENERRTEAENEELGQLRREQQEVRDLFNDLTAPAETEGDRP